MRLVIFDVDGTLVDSQADIIASMHAAFDAQDLMRPMRADILGIVGLSLDVAMRRLAPEADNDRLVQAYKDSYADLRRANGAASSPLYPGARAVLDTLTTRDDMLLGVATGKSKRGLDGLIEAHGLQGVFATQQVADFHPSKPHPSMIHAALSETGTDAENAVMIGDTSYDLDMAAAAGVRGIGVAWGYHPPTRLGAAHTIIDRFEDLHRVLDTLWSDIP
ncbi:HAD-IA family hydrolase [uncultured Tateyamaria sp.]|uniref:HAD-IA family hydrolase n=1 Tax=uncultured Tateyamaria sp. TaxID=455651 RepID=UPI002633174B|nr:HAD-IA family hydrolase [uncultured Tateyamaria sp.]